MAMVADAADEPQNVKRFWVSWWEPAVNGDSRPVVVPPKSVVPHYWDSGFRQYLGGIEDHSICAVVLAKDADAVRETVARYWVPRLEFRFIEEKPDGWMPEPTRFAPENGPVGDSRQ